MDYLVLGLLLWSFVHFFPALSPATKKAFIWRFGGLAYMAVFALLIVLSLLLMVFGWSSSTPTFLYYLPDFSRLLAALLIALGFILFVASKLPTNIKQTIRHPQLSGVVLWAVAQLLVNGDSRSLLLFVWLAVWAIVEVVLINKREGQWVKPEQVSWLYDLLCGVIGIIVFIGVVFAHPYLSGIALR